MTPAAPARIFAIRARNGQTATVFRRGPSKVTQLLTWDLKHDRITDDQWLRAAVYPMRSDLLPDGQHLIYFAATHKGSDESNYTAVSRPPYWTALHFYGQYGIGMGVAFSSTTNAIGQTHDLVLPRPKRLPQV